ncbi:MAG: thiamine diphosphokinase [Acutalibacteraceae bacterium]
MGICYIFGAGEGLPEAFKKNDGDLVIAADAGIKHLNSLGVKPDIAVGDFDSLGFVPECKEVIRHPVMKDDTDMLSAVKAGFERGYSRFMLYGGAGGRPDHTFANYQTLIYIAERGGLGFLCLNGFTASAIINGGLEFSNRSAGDISVFSLSEKSEGVTLKGLLYELSGAQLSYAFPLGVSNSFTGTQATVEAERGAVLVIWRGNASLISAAYTLHKGARAEIL